MRVWPLLGGAAVLAGAAGITGVVVSGSSGDDADSGAPTDTTVERSARRGRSRTDLARTEELDGVDRSRHADGHSSSPPTGTLDRAAGRRRRDRARRRRRRGRRPADRRPARPDPAVAPARAGRRATATTCSQLEYVLAVDGLRRGARRDGRRRLDGGDHRGRRGLPGGPRPGRRRRDRRRRGRVHRRARARRRRRGRASVSRPRRPGSRSPAPSRPCTSTSTSTTPTCSPSATRSTSSCPPATSSPAR